jgi:stringent starvation protein B
MHEWMSDNAHTPHIVVDTAVDGVNVPLEHIKDGKIILNISETAAHNLKLTNDGASFRARFSGVPFDVWVPMRSVLGIYARETGKGMIFSHDANIAPVQAVDPGDHVETAGKRAHLRVVK